MASVNKNNLKLKEEAREIRKYLKGRLIWNSANGNTYVRKKHGPIGGKHS